MSDNPFMTMQEVADRLGIPAHRAYAWSCAGMLPTQRMGRRHLVHRAELERWIAEGRPNLAKQKQAEQAPTAPERQTVAIQAEGLTIELTISIKPDTERRKIRPLVSIR